MADDKERFERIYRENFAAVLRFAAFRIDPERAKDVAAETFLVAWRRLDDVPADPRPWLLGVARKVIADQFRSQARRNALAARLQDSPNREVDGDVAAELSERERVLAAFAALREHDREILRVVAWDALSPAEAAEALGLTRLAFAVRLHRARRRLERKLERADEAPPQTSISQRRRHADALP